ncbi:MAG: helix-turn-helix transcriptional regulator [Polaromonas sp.]
MPELQLSVNEAAEQLGVSRVTLSRVINGRSAITAGMALRMQGPYDLWQSARKVNRRSGKQSGPRSKPTPDVRCMRDVDRHCIQGTWLILSLQLPEVDSCGRSSSQRFFHLER